MNGKMKTFMATILLSSLLSAGLVLLKGCKESEPTTPPELTEEVAAAAVEQTICPVMENPINEQYFTEHKGQKVYFCCPECKEKFEADPEKYIAKLPQFKK